MPNPGVVVDQGALRNPISVKHARPKLRVVGKLGRHKTFQLRAGLNHALLGPHPRKSRHSFDSLKKPIGIAIKHQIQLDFTVIVERHTSAVRDAWDREGTVELQILPQIVRKLE